MDLNDIMEFTSDKIASDNYYKLIYHLACEVKRLENKVEELVYTKADDPNYNPMEE